MGALLSVERFPILASIGLVAIVASILRRGSRFRDSIPTVGLGSGLLAGQIAAIRSVTSSQNRLQDGYEKARLTKRGTDLAETIHRVRPTHFDESIYPRAGTFDGFRFYDELTTETDLDVPHRLVSTSTEFLAFGAGRHARPGRFWAANEMEAMLAYMLTHYEMRMEREGVIPEPKWFGGSLIVDTDVRVLFRKREAPVY